MSIVAKVKNNASLTAFQKKVFLATLKIPRGQVRTYAWVAGEVGSPSGVRAVGQALKKNPYAPGVPCHRVVASNGSIGGYSGKGGVRGKRKLLVEEGYDTFI